MSGHAQALVLINVLYDIWTTLLVGSTFGILGNVFVADAFALSQLTVYSTIISLMARARIVDVAGVRASGAILGVLMSIVFWCLTLAYGEDTFYDGDPPNPFGSIVLHLLFPLDAAFAARGAFRNVSYLDVVYTVFFTAGYSIIFVASVPYPFAARLDAWGRTGISLAGSGGAIVAHAGLVRAERR